MAVLGIITCEILIHEFAFILGTDSSIDRITIIENSNSIKLIQLLQSKYSINVQCIPHLNNYDKEPSENLEVIVIVQELELHRNKKILRKAIIDSSRNLAHHVDTFMLGYGLCGNALDNPKELINANIPVFIPMDGKHPVYDCVGLIIGGRNCYHAEQCNEPGTFFIIPGMSYNWQKMLQRNFPDKSVKAIKSMFAKYKRALLIPDPTITLEEMKTNIEEFINITELKIETRPGTIDILLQKWDSAKESLKIKNDMKHEIEKQKSIL